MRNGKAQHTPRAIRFTSVPNKTFIFGIFKDFFLSFATFLCYNEEMYHTCIATKEAHYELWKKGDFPQGKAACL